MPTPYAMGRKAGENYRLHEILTRNPFEHYSHSWHEWERGFTGGLKNLLAVN